jgi:N-acetylneuraminic acid mutarotase
MRTGYMTTRWSCLAIFLTTVVLAGCGGGGGGGGGSAVSTSSSGATAVNAPTITTQPSSQSVAVGGTDITLSVAATGNGTLTYQWYFNGTAISGATSTTYKPSSSASSAGSYDCVVTNTLNGMTAQTTSSTVTLTVVTGPSAVTISGESAVLPNSASHTVSVTATAGASYVWTVSDGTIASGQGTAQITYTSGALGQNQVTVTVSNLAGTVAGVKNVVVVATLPVVSVFAPQSVLVGSTNVIASAPVAAGLTFDWILTPGTTAATQSASPGTGEFGYSAGATAGSYQLAVTATDSAGNSASASQSFSVVQNTFVRDSRDATPRTGHTATLMNDGRVLVVGGDAGVPGTASIPVATAEIYDPVSMQWAFVNPLPAPRFGHAATLLNDGRVLVAGGTDATGAILASVEIFNPVTQTWTAGASLNTARKSPDTTLLADGRVLVSGGANANGRLASAEVYDPVADSWSSAGTMNVARELHSATLMRNGQVLVVGGEASSPAVTPIAERYDPTANTWTPTGALQYGVTGLSAVVLVSGKVLMSGSYAEIYDPVADSWQFSVPIPTTGLPPEQTGSDGTTAILMADGRVFVGGQIYDPVAQTWNYPGTSVPTASGATTTALQNGQALVVGGVNWGTTAEADYYSSTPSAMVFDPASGAQTPLGSAAHAGYNAASSVLTDGRVLVTGGIGSPGLGGLMAGDTGVTSADLFDATTNTWTAAAPMSVDREGHVQTTLANGFVLVTGGSNGYDGGSAAVLASTEVYNPATNAWTTAGSMSTARYQHTATLVGSGNVLVVGGSNQPDQPSGCSCTTYVASVDLYNPTSNAWTPTGALNTARESHTATLLSNGTVLVTGGYGGATSTLQNLGSALASAEIYDPAAATWSVVAPMNSPRMNHTATLLSNGKVLVTGGTNGTATVASAEIYDPVANTWTTVAPMSTARQLQKAQLLQNNDVLVVGGLNDSANAYFGVGSAEVYDPVAGTWSPAGSMVTVRQGFILSPLPDGRVMLDAGEPNHSGLPEFYHW